MWLIFFFFQAEDGIRDVAVTGVQTCALPISPGGEGNRGASAGIVPWQEVTRRPKRQPGGGGGSRPDAPRAGSGPVRLLLYRFSMDTIRRPISGAGTDPTSLKYRIFNDREPWLQGAPLVVVVEL